MNTSNNTKSRYAWVDLAKGICMLAVVILYSAKVTQDTLGDAGWVHDWVNFARPFRMPDFFLISGLFLANVINRPLSSYIDTKVIHYIYFFCLWTLINLLILYAIGEYHGGFLDFIKQLWVMMSSWPFKMLWFIQMLPAYFIFTRLTRRIPKWAIFSLACILHAFPVIHTDRMIIDEFWNRFVFFYAGYAFAPFFFSLVKYAQEHVKEALIFLFIWAITNGLLVNYGFADKPFVGVLLGLAGAVAIISTAALIEKVNFTNWIKYLGEHSIVIYLAFYWFMELAAYLLQPLTIFTANKGMFAMLITVFGILGSLSLYWLVNWKAKDRWLFSRPALLTIGK